MFVFVELVKTNFQKKKEEIYTFLGYCYRSTYDRFVHRYKVIDCVRSKLYPHGPLNEESAAYICDELYIENDVAYGNTKLFIKQPLVR